MNFAKKTENELRPVSKLRSDLVKHRAATSISRDSRRQLTIWFEVLFIVFKYCQNMLLDFILENISFEIVHRVRNLVFKPLSCRGMKQL